MTMAELLRERGYQTVAFSNNLYISQTCNIAQGFEDIFWPIELHAPRGNSVSEFINRVLRPAGHVGTALGALTAEDAGGKFTNQLVARWLDRRDRQQPFFLFINYMEAHYPYRPHLPHRRVFIAEEAIEQSYRCDWDKAISYSVLKRDCYSPDELALLNNTYDAETRLLDDHVGELLDILAERVSLDNALVIVTADHGENLGDHHLMDHQWCVYQTLASVPLIVRYPKRVRPGREECVVQTVDLLPTVMHAVHGEPVPTASTFGRSLLLPRPAQERSATVATSRSSALGELALVGRVGVTERISPASPPLATAQRMDCRFDRRPFLGELRAIRQGPWKYIVRADGREELYNLATDPGEAEDLIDRRRPVADHLARRLQQWLAAANRYEGSDMVGSGQRLSEDARRRLRDLGYIH
jgi:arylsulfatase A-like enzyme